MKVLSDLGFSPTAIARKMEKSHNTVIKYLNSDVYNNPDVASIVERLRKNEMDDLTVLGGKARQRAHDIFDTGKPALIPTIAVMDRVFQQRRLLEGRSTANIANLTAIIEAAAGMSRDGAQAEAGQGKAEPRPPAGPERKTDRASEEAEGEKSR